MQMQRFLEEQVPRLLRYVEHADEALVGNPEVDAFVCDLEEVLGRVTWPRAGARVWLPGEDTFFWCLDQLGILADPRSGFSRGDPWVACQLGDLRAMAQRLRAGQSLPPGYEIHFTAPFDENDPDWDPLIDGELEASPSAAGDADS